MSTLVEKFIDAPRALIVLVNLPKIYTLNFLLVSGRYLAPYIFYKQICQEQEIGSCNESGSCFYLPVDQSQHDFPTISFVFFN